MLVNIKVTWTLNVAFGSSATYQVSARNARDTKPHIEPSDLTSS